VRRLRILFLAANPLETERLRLDEEIRTIEERIRGAPLTERISLNSAWAVRVKDLVQSLRRAPGIVHFSGHGTPEGIILEGSEGEAQPVPGAALAELFRLEGSSVRCAVLNACFTEEQARAIAEHVPFVVGTWPSIEDRDAVAFAGRFYESIAHGESLGAAFEAGGNEIALQGGSPLSHRSFHKEGKDPTAAVLLRRPSPWRRVALSAAVVVMAAGLWLWFRPSGPPPVVWQNTELVFDESLAMADDLPAIDGGLTSKLKAAREKVAEFVRPRNTDNLALRQASGCETAGDLVVPFRTGAQESIDRALVDLAPSANTFPLAESVIAATGDFNDPSRFPSDRTRRQIIVFTAAGDNCAADPAALLGERWDELGEGIDLRIDFVGLGISPTDPGADQLRGMAASVDGRTWLVENEQQLTDVLSFLLDLEPVLEAAEDIAATGNAVVVPQGETAAALNRCDPAAAQDAHAKAVVALERADPALTDLATRDGRQLYVRTHEAGSTWAAKLGEVLAADEALLRLLRMNVPTSPDACDRLRSGSAWQSTVRAQLKAVGNADAALDVLEQRTDELKAEIPTLPTG
jgi:CHAT domain